MALQHAGEDAGAYLIEGLVNFLVSDDPSAVTVRKNFNYLVIPIMNPDGIYHGTSRYNMEMEDLNSIWIDDALAQPEVTGVKKWADSWLVDGQTIDLFIDVHNHSQFHNYNVFVYLDESLDSLGRAFSIHWPVKWWKTTFKGSSCTWFNQKGVPCGTIELSQSYVRENEYLTIRDYHQFGEGTALGLLDYFKPD